MTRAVSLTGIPAPVEPPARRYGYLDIETWHGHKAATGEELEVYLNGVLMEHVTVADDSCDAPYVEMLVGLNLSESQEALIQDYLTLGRAKYLGGRRVRLYGSVVIVPKHPQIVGGVELEVILDAWRRSGFGR